MRVGATSQVVPSGSVRSFSPAEERAEPAPLTAAALPCLSSASSFGAGPVTRRPIPGSFIAALRGDVEPATLDHLDGVRVERCLGRSDANGRRVTWLQLSAAHRPGLIDELRRAGHETLWAAPNYAYEGDLREGQPAHTVRAGKDPLLDDQYHLVTMRAIEAWGIESGSPDLVVAVTDNGTDIDHEDLAANIYENPDEIPANGIDDDGNGLVDDVHSWNFSGDNDDVRGGKHGTHTVGIVGAAGDNGKGVSGVAPGVTMLPIKWDGDGAWTTAVIVSSYLYAVDRGARIVSTSYNIDRWPGDAAIERVLEHMGEKGILHFNSAGNSNEEQPARTALKNVILVASTMSNLAFWDDRRAAYSNYGAGIDLAAPGSDVMSTLPGNEYGRESGTSMAAPNAAAVAALVWSKNPTWTGEQVYAQVFGTADNIDAKNPDYVGKLGGGRVNALRALTEQVPPPKLSARREGDHLYVRLGAVFDTRSANQRESWRMERADGTVVSMGPPQRVHIATNELRFNLQGLAPGDYRLIASSAHLRDPFGQRLAGDFVYSFTISPTSRASLSCRPRP